MRININLASRPYENAQRFFVRWGAVLLVMIVVTVLLVVAAARSWRANHVLERSVAQERDRLNKLNDQEKADLAILNQPGNQDVRQRSQALNALIVRKSVSWTRIFSDLEKMMPTRLHVVQIAPQLSPANELQIRMTVAGSSRDKAIELVQNMEKAPDFRNPQIVSESLTAGKGAGQQQGDTVNFNIVALYAPSNKPPAPEPPAQTASNEATPAATNAAENPPAKSSSPRETKSARRAPAQPKGGRP